MSKRQREKLKARLIKTRQAIYDADLDDDRSHAAVAALNALIGELTHCPS